MCVTMVAPFRGYVSTGAHFLRGAPRKKRVYRGAGLARRDSEEESVKRGYQFGRTVFKWNDVLNDRIVLQDVRRQQSSTYTLRSSTINDQTHIYPWD